VQKRRLLLAVTGVALSGLIATLVVFITAGDGKLVGPANADYWSKRIVTCQDTSLLTTDAVLKHSYDCLKSSIRDAVYNESFDQWVAAAEPIMAEDIKLEYVCHIPGHDLGAELSDYYGGDFRRAIMALGWDICGGGIVHGIFDVWGKSQHSPESWLEIGQACIDQNKLRYSTCGDAIGHSAYESLGQDLSKSIGLCDSMPESWIQNSCANGAFMQKYYPQSSALKYTRASVIPPWKELVMFCDDLPYEDFGTNDGCYGGAGWVIGNNIFFNLAALTTTSNEYDSTPAMDAEVIKQVKEGFLACEVNVASGKNKGNPTVCVDLMLNRMPLFWYMDTDKFINFCTEVTLGREKGSLERCLAGGLEHITPGSMGKVVERFPSVADTIRARNPYLAGLVGNGS
jgi:hypothetical protein